MAQNLEINGVTYNGVESLSIPKSGGGSAAFPDTSDATAIAEDILSGKTAYVNGNKLTGTGRGWQPHPDWFDIEAIYNNDVQAGYTKRFIFLLSDSNNTINLATITVGGTAWKTSDGQFYTSATTHTWNRAFDRACSDGYKTRWVIGYCATTDVSFNHRSIDSLYLYIGACNVTSFVFGATANPTNFTIQAIRCSALTTGSASCIGVSAFQRCYGLVSVDIPYGATSIGDNAFNSTSILKVNAPNSIISIGEYAFNYCRALANFDIPDSVITIGLEAFSYCYALFEIIIPNSVTTISDNAFIYCYSVNRIILSSSVTSIGTNAFSSTLAVKSISVPANFDVVLKLVGIYLSVSSIVDLFNNLKDNTGQPAKTLTIGSTNIAKLSTAEKAIATNKNWILA